MGDAKRIHGGEDAARYHDCPHRNGTDAGRFSPVPTGGQCGGSGRDRRTTQPLLRHTVHIGQFCVESIGLLEERIAGRENAD